MSISSVNAIDISNSTINAILSDESALQNDEISIDSSSKLINDLSQAENNDIIMIEKGTYKVSDFEITKNLTIQGNADPLDVIIDGERKSSIFLIRDDAVHVTFKNITFINADTDGFGGAISMETGHVYVDNCYFINNTATVNAGGISNYGNETHRGYLLLNNSFFMNNHAGHDGGAVTTCFADSYIYNCVFINNSAHRDGGAIRVSVSGYGNVEDCIFMFNHADEWGGAYYSWSGESHINRCIFMNNTAGTNGGAVMVSGNINLENSIITNNNGGETGGSFYIQQPMYDAKTIINIHNNIITNNSSPNGQEIFIKWKDIKSLYTKFNDNDWGDENPNDSSVIDPNHVTDRSKVSSTIKSNLFSILNVNLLDKYADLLEDFFPDNSLENLKDNFKTTEKSDQNENNEHTSSDAKTSDTVKRPFESYENTTTTSNSDNSSNLIERNLNQELVSGNSTSHGEDEKAYELNKTGGSVAKQVNLDIRYFIAITAIVFILLAIGYRRQKKSK
ncbi:hypothetical protein [Methanobrevibacter sp.]|uniref:hypothetical protein n=1 Tax=Methanobrevibacter sp. TaxID=66852 RepID=UPI0025D7BFF5|nr:hypothetical protein [Methanobrevibacter sp.]MBQ2665162.1 hypothetical protein [Methanobrevibacter sp.]